MSDKNKKRRVHLDIVKKIHKGKQYRSVLLRTSYRKDGKVLHETLGNLSDLPDDLIDVIKNRLASDKPLVGNDSSFKITRSLPHGNVNAVLSVAKDIGIDRLISSTSSRERDLIMAMIADRIISPGSKLSCANGLDPDTAPNSLAMQLKLGTVDVHELYDAMDWLLAKQKRIENKLAKRHLADGTLVLFDVSSSYYTGRKSELVKHGYSRDHRADQPQIVYGLLCDRDGRPIAIEVFPGNTADPKAFTQFVSHVRKRFGIQTVVFVGDRGMITSARINEDLRDVEGLEWISALNSKSIRKLVDAGHIDRSLFDERDLAEITDEENFPGERLVVCRNPLLADERARKRTELLAATEADLDKIVAATKRASHKLKGKDKIALRVGRVINKRKMAKHFGQFFVRSPRREDRGRGIRGRHLCGADEPAGGDDGGGRSGVDVQEFAARGASVPEHEVGGPSHPSDLPQQRRPDSLARFLMHVGVLRGVGDARANASGVVRGHGSSISGIEPQVGCVEGCSFGFREGEGP